MCPFFCRATVIIFTARVLQDEPEPLRQTVRSHLGVMRPCLRRIVYSQYTSNLFMFTMLNQVMTPFPRLLHYVCVGSRLRYQLFTVIRRKWTSLLCVASAITRLNTPRFFLGGHVKSVVHATPVDTREELIVRIHALLLNEFNADFKR
jgi:hypothetical protein